MSLEFAAQNVPLVQARAAIAATEAVIRSHSKTFFFATGLLPAHARRAVRVLYGFCRATDDLVDRHGTTLDELEDWRREVMLPPDQQQNPLLLSWALVRAQYNINPRFEQELIDGVRMDLQPRFYQTWEQLQRYCYHVASTVGLLSMPIIGVAQGATFEQAAPFAIRLGIALQLTNVLRDIGEDAANGRVYLPVEDLRRFGLTPGDVLNRVQDSRFVALMRFEIERARALYHEALPGIRLLHPAARPAVGAAALLYRAILDEIEKIQYHVYEFRAHTSAAQKIARLPGILWTVVRLQPPTI